MPELSGLDRALIIEEILIFYSLFLEASNFEVANLIIINKGNIKFFEWIYSIYNKRSMRLYLVFGNIS
jgi:hypothetical protein